MAKGSVRKKGKKWYYRFYIEDESGNRIQKEFPGTESKAETESLLRKAMEDYDNKKFIAKNENVTLSDMLDMWVEEELKPGSLSNGTVMAYQATVRRIKQHPIGKRKLRSVTADHLQSFMDLLSFGGTKPDGTVAQPLSIGGIRQYSAVLQGAFRFAVFPKKLISFNPMQYVIRRNQAEDYELFVENNAIQQVTPTINHEQFKELIAYLEKKNNPAILPIQIAYYTGLRIGEACGLDWQDINLEEQYLTVRRSMRYNQMRHKVEVGPTKRKKVREVDFGNVLTDILKKAKKEQLQNKMKYGELYSLNYYVEVKERNRSYFEVYTLGMNENVPEDYKPLSLVCLRPDGAYESPSTVSLVCRSAQKKIPGLEDFHFHTLRHTFTSNLLSYGAAPKEVQELLGHADVSTTMNIYAHASREAKRSSAKLLDNAMGID